MVLKKVAFHVHGQKIQNFVKLKELLPYSSKEYSPSGPKIPKPGSNVDDSGVCPHCGDVSFSKFTKIFQKAMNDFSYRIVASSNMRY